MPGCTSETILCLRFRCIAALLFWLQVIGLTKVMGKDYADTGITVNAIAPAVVRTAMVDALPESQVVCVDVCMRYGMRARVCTQLLPIMRGTPGHFPATCCCT